MFVWLARWRWLVALACLILLATPLPAHAPPKKGTQYAFLVACSGYDKTELKPLPYTINDVEEFRKALIESGFGPGDIKVLHDKQPERRYLSEKAKILKELQLLLKGLKPEDTVVMALSGHGVHFKGEPTGYFCPVDASLGNKSTLIPLDGEGGLFELLKGCRAGRKLLLMNACRNDPASDLAQAANKINLDDEDREVVPEGIAALYSCQQGDKSYYDPDRKMGLFFIHLCKAWRGGYLKEAKPLTLEDVFDQVTRETKRDADKTFGATQVPVVKREYAGEWILDRGNLVARAARNRGKELLDRHRYDEAIEAFTEAIRLNPRDGSAHGWRGWTHFCRHQKEDALADAREAVKLAPEEPLGYAVRALYPGLCPGGHNDLELAQKDADQAVRLNERLLLTRFIQARVLSRRQKLSEGLLAAEEAIRLDRRSAWGYLARGWAHFEKKDWRRASADFTRAMDLDPKFSWPYEFRGLASVMEKEWDRAIADCNKAIDLNPPFAWAYCTRGLAYLGKKDWDQAITDFSRAIELDPQFFWPYYHRAWAYWEKKELDRTIADCTRALEIDPTSAPPYERRGLAYVAKKEWDRALANCDKSVELDPKFAAAYCTRGLAYGGKRDWERAITDYSRAIELDPQFFWPYYHRAWAYWEKKEWDRAIADCNRATEIDPTSALPHERRGITYVLKKEWDQAIASCDKAIELDPKFAWTYNTRGLAYGGKNDRERAIADYTQAIKLDPQFFWPCFHRGWANAKNKEWDRAVADFTRAIDIDPQFVSAYRGRAFAYEQGGNFAAAEADRRTVKELEK